VCSDIQSKLMLQRQCVVTSNPNWCYKDSV